MPTLNGVDIFGTISKVSTSSIPRRAQVTTFPGINGTQRLDMGSVGNISVVTGYIFGTNISAIYAQEAAIRSFHESSGSWDFVDNTGTIYARTRILSFSFDEGITVSYTATLNGFSRKYSIQLIHGA